MTKFLLGMAVGYMFSDMIDDLLGRGMKKVSEEESSAEKAYQESAVKAAHHIQPDGV